MTTASLTPGATNAIMTRMPTNKDRFRKSFLLGLVIVVSAAFLWMLQEFLFTILVAAVFSGLAHPAYTRLERALGGRRHLAASLVLVGAVLLVVVPLVGLFSVVVEQAITVTSNVRPFVERLFNDPRFVQDWLTRVPFLSRLEPYREQLIARAGEVSAMAGAFLFESVSQTTLVTIRVVFHFFLILYSMFFFLLEGPGMLNTMAGYLPLRERDVARVKERFVSITRATVKGTIAIGIVQGLLSGAAFWAVGIPDVLFWTVVMVVLSILPVVGGLIVWVPAAIYLVVIGHIWQAIGLTLFCSLVVGSVDNLLRPRLVGGDTKMHDLVILFSTLGGLFAFGPLGFIVGPILAGVFVTTWQIFGTAYQDVLEDAPPDEPMPSVALEEPVATAAEIP